MASGAGATGKEARDAMRRTLQTRLRVLDMNKRERENADEDTTFTAHRELLASNWMQNNDKEGRIIHEEPAYLFINSAARNREVWPNAAHFHLSLDSELDNVIKAELIQASIPLIDPTVHADNNTIRYSFTPHTGAAVKEVVIPVGSYRGSELALEIQTQLNLDWHEARITGALNTMDYTRGYLVDGSNNIESTIEQFRVQYLRPRNRFVFQIVDSDLQPTNTAFAIHFTLPPLLDASLTEREQTDDLSKVLGFEREQFAVNGTYDGTTNTYYIVSTDDDPDFGPADTVDTRYRYSVHSNHSADLRGNLAVIVDIHPFNDNSMLGIDDKGTGALNLRNYFSIVLLRDPSHVNDRMTEINTNTYPLKAEFREGRTRVKDIWVTLRRPDGSIMDFGCTDFFLTLRLTVQRVYAEKPVFTR